MTIIITKMKEGKKTTQIDSFTIFLFHRDMDCDYYELCELLYIEIDHSIECELYTVQYWRCPSRHELYLCKNHVEVLEFLCPYGYIPLNHPCS